MRLPKTSDGKPRWLLHSPQQLEMLVFILVGAVSMLGVFGIENAETRRRHAALERNAADIAASLRQLDTEHEIYLRASAALFAMHGTVTAQDLTQLQRLMNFDHYRQGSLGVGWAPRVSVSGMNQPVPGRQARTLPAPRDAEASISPVGGIGPHDVFTVAFMDPPNEENAAAVGFDPYAEPVRRAAMDRAAAIDAPVATGRIGLRQDDGRASSAGFLIYMPVFGNASSSSAGTIRAPPGVLRGYVFMPFRAPDLLAIASRLAAHDNIHVVAYDGPVVLGRVMASFGDAAEAGTPLTRQVMIANRPWQLLVSAERPEGLSRLSQITILSGLIVALLLSLLIRMTYQKINEEQQLLEWQASESGIRNSLTRELNHRVKNTLATVLSIVTLTRRRETDLDSYVESLSGRIRALSATHDLLTSNDWSSIELRQIIVTELAPYIGANDDHVSLDGPDIRLAPNDSLTLGLAVHELATNAAKYGALSALGGGIAVRWQKLSDQIVEIHWRETGGPMVTAPSKRGFGRDLIEKILAHELGSPVKLDFAADGLQCVFQVPLRKPANFVLRTPPAPPMSAKSE